MGIRVESVLVVEYEGLCGSFYGLFFLPGLIPAGLGGSGDFFLVFISF